MSPSFKESVCAYYKCSGSAFHRTVLEQTVHPTKKPIVRMLLGRRGRSGVFAWEKSYIRRLGVVTSSKEVCIAAARIRKESRQNAHCLVRMFGVGMSGRRLARLAKRVMAH